MPPGDGKGQTGRDPTAGRSTGQDRLLVKWSKKPRLPTAHCAGSCTESHHRDGSQEGEIHFQQHQMIGRCCWRCWDEQWHRSDGTSQLCQGHILTMQKVQPPPLMLLQSPQRDGVKVSPAQSRLGIAGGGVLLTLQRFCPPQRVPAWASCPNPSLGCSLSPGMVTATTEGWRQQPMALPGPGGHRGGAGGVSATVGAAEFRSHRPSSPLGGGDAELKPPDVWTRVGATGGLGTSTGLGRAMHGATLAARGWSGGSVG